MVGFGHVVALRYRPKIVPQSTEYNDWDVTAGGLQCQFAGNAAVGRQVAVRVANDQVGLLAVGDRCGCLNLAGLKCFVALAIEKRTQDVARFT